MADITAKLDKRQHVLDVLSYMEHVIASDQIPLLKEEMLEDIHFVQRTIKEEGVIPPVTRQISGQTVILRRTTDKY